MTNPDKELLIQILIEVKYAIDHGDTSAIQNVIANLEVMSGDSEDKIFDLDEKLYQAFKAGCLSANDGIFPSEFEEEIKVLFEEWRNKKAP